MSHSTHSVAHHERTSWQWRVLFLATAATVILGVIGFQKYGRLGPETTAGHPVSEAPGIPTALYHTLQLFILHTPHFERPLNLPLELARWLAAGVFFAAIIGALARVYAMELRHFRLGIGHGHVVICGAGWRGLALVRDFLRPGTETGAASAHRKEKVIVIEMNPDCEGLLVCQKLGVPYLVADATDPKTLKAAGVHKARLLAATCSADGTNLEIAIHARQLAEAVRTEDEPLKCHIHLSNLDLRTMARQKSLIAGDTRRIVVSTVGIDIYENSARWLFQRYPLDWKPITAESQFRVHLVIVGFGQLGEAVLIQAGRIGHFANGQPLAVTVIDHDAAKKETLFRSRYPLIDSVCDLAFQSLAASDPAVVALVQKICDQPSTILTCAVCLPEDSMSLALALKLKDALTKCRSPIRVRLSSRAGMALLLSEKRQHELFGDQIRAFGMLEDVCNRKSLENPELDDLARKIHEAYLDEVKNDKDNPAAVPWDQLPEDFKSSNRHAADHIDVKLRAIGYKAMDKPQTSEPLTEFLPEHFDILAPMEHARYCAERFLGGWRYDPKPKDLINKTNPTLVPWKDVSKEDRKKDLSQIQAIPNALKKLGRVICR